MPFKFEGSDFSLKHGSVVIAAITSCTNTSNPSVMLGAGNNTRNILLKTRSDRANAKRTRMHSSKMRTVRSSGRLGEGRGCLLPGGVPVPGGVCSWGGVSAPGGSVSQWGRHPPRGQTDACKNITFATWKFYQLARASAAREGKKLKQILLHKVGFECSHHLMVCPPLNPYS